MNSETPSASTSHESFQDFNEEFNRDGAIRKIAHVVESMDDDYGGPARSIPDLCRCQQGAGLHPVIYTGSHDGKVRNSQLASQPLPMKVFSQIGPSKLRFCPALLIALLADARARRIQAIHLHSPWNFVALAAGIASLVGGVRLIFSPRGSLFPWSLSQGRLRKMVAWFVFMRMMLHRAHAIHVTDQSEADAVKSLGLTTRIDVVPNSIDLGEVESLPQRENAKSILGLQANRRYALFISRIHPKKGLLELILAWEAEQIAKFGWQLLIVGPESDPVYAAEVRALAAMPSLAGSVRLMAPVYGPGRLNFFAASDLFILPSHSENFGNAIAEAMLFGLPILTTTGTPWTDITAQGLGWYIQLNPTELRRALREAAEMHPDALRSMGSRGRDYVSSRFSRASLHEKVWRLYNDSPYLKFPCG